MKRRKRDFPERAYRKLQRKKVEYESEAKVVEAVVGLLIVLLFVLYSWSTGGFI